MVMICLITRPFGPKTAIVITNFVRVLLAQSVFQPWVRSETHVSQRAAPAGVQRRKRSSSHWVQPLLSHPVLTVFLLLDTLAEGLVTLNVCCSGCCEDCCVEPERLHRRTLSGGVFCGAGGSCSGVAHRASSVTAGSGTIVLARSTDVGWTMGLSKAGLSCTVCSGWCATFGASLELSAAWTWL